MGRLLVAVTLGLGLAGCSLGINPDTSRFSCDTNKDCGAHFECIAQLAGGGRCFREGECHPETCNGVDDDCDGGIDEDWDLATDSAHCGSCDTACATGAACSAAVCIEIICNDGLDNDGDHLTDCADPDCPCHA
jgi:hypothetical protein